MTLNSMYQEEKLHDIFSEDVLPFVIVLITQCVFHEGRGLHRCEVFAHSFKNRNGIFDVLMILFDVVL